MDSDIYGILITGFILIAFVIKYMAILRHNPKESHCIPGNPKNHKASEEGTNNISSKNLPPLPVYPLVARTIYRKKEKLMKSKIAHTALTTDLRMRYPELVEFQPEIEQANIESIPKKKPPPIVEKKEVNEPEIVKPKREVPIEKTKVVVETKPIKKTVKEIKKEVKTLTKAEASAAATFEQRRN